jgi:biopolymer transport protein ExbB/TolQ
MKKNVFLIMLLLVLSLANLLAIDEATEGAKGNKAVAEEVQSDAKGNETVVAEDGEIKVDPVQVWNDSKPFSYYIAACFLFAVFFGGYKAYLFFVKEKLDANQFHLKMKGLVKSGNITEAINNAKLVKKTTLGQIYWIGLWGYKDAKESGKTGQNLKEEVQHAFNEAAFQTLPVIDRGLHWFDLLAQISTYFGLLGTIWGLIIAFTAMSSGKGDNATLIVGIQQAMGTTALGLVGAIAIQIIKGLLSSKSEKMLNTIDEYSVKIMNVINNQVQE